jgi:hypothetical protein
MSYSAGMPVIDLRQREEHDSLRELTISAGDELEILVNDPSDSDLRWLVSELPDGLINVTRRDQDWTDEQGGTLRLHLRIVRATPGAVVLTHGPENSAPADPASSMVTIAVRPL